MKCNIGWQKGFNSREKWMRKRISKRVHVKTRQHILLKHKECEYPYCAICEGGLALCTVCGGAAGSLPTECPGMNMDEETLERVYAGEIDYIHGRWVEGAISVCSPAYGRRNVKF